MGDTAGCEMSDCMCGAVGVDLDYHHEHCAVWLKAELDAEKLRQKMLSTCYEHSKRELESQLQAANSRPANVKVWIVMGEDWPIAVFTTKEDADAFSEGDSVEEFEVWTSVPPKWKYWHQGFLHETIT